MLDIEAGVWPHVVHAVGSSAGVFLDPLFESKLKYFLLGRIVQ